MKRWYAVQSQPRAERTALAHLERQGFESYLPVYLKRRSHARRIEQVRAPLFPRYLFVHFDLTAVRWQAIHSTVGVARLVSNGNVPVPLPQGVMEEIHRREDKGGLVRVVPNLSRGQRVVIEAGTFLDQTGLFECATDDERVVILLDLLGRQVRVQVPADAVSAAA